MRAAYRRREGRPSEWLDSGTTVFNKSGAVSERSATATLMMPLPGPPRTQTLLKLGIMKQTFYSTQLTSRSGRVLSIFAHELQTVLPAGSDLAMLVRTCRLVMLRRMRRD